MAPLSVAQPAFGLKPARTIVDKAVHRVVRVLLNGTMWQGVKTFNRPLASEGLAPIVVAEWLEHPIKSATHYFLDHCAVFR